MKDIETEKFRAPATGSENNGAGGIKFYSLRHLLWAFVIAAPFMTFNH